MRLYRNEKQVALTNFEIVLLDGDSIMVPEHPGVVQVLGEVNRPGLVQHAKNKSLKGYLENAGGFTQYAGKNNITIIYANGDVRIKKRFRSPEISEGTIIMVYAKENKNPFNFTEFTTNIASLITSAATLYLLTVK